MTNPNKLADALRNIVNMLREHPAMQSREYIGLGIAANNALREYDASLAEHDAQPAPAMISEERKQRLCALERCIQGREADANRMDEETGDPWASLGYREDTAQLVILHEQLSQPAPAPVQVDKRDREADRARFPDVQFNSWLDDGISDCGHTVWDTIGDVCDAWHGWSAREFYAHPPAPAADGAGELVQMPGGMSAGRVLVDEAFAVLTDRSGFDGWWADIDDETTREIRDEMAGRFNAAIAALRQPVPDAVREAKETMLSQVKWEACGCGCPQGRKPADAVSVTWLRAVQQVEAATARAEEGK